MKWLPNHSDFYTSHGFTNQKLLVCTEDGKLLCLDTTGKLFAALQLETSINCLDTDGKLIVGGCGDGSVRAWMMQQGKFKEIQRILKAHNGAVTAIALGENVESLSTVGGIQQQQQQSLGGPISEMMVTGSDSCSTRIWRLTYDK